MNLREPASEDQKSKGQRPCSVALILGATGGLGSSFARELAARRVDLILSGRNPDSLQKLQRELSTTHSIQVEVEPADLCNQADVDRLQSLIDNRIEIDWLINASGLAYWGPESELTQEGARDLCQINLLTPMRLIRSTHRAFAERGGGRIIHVASAAAFFAMPFLSTYCATKTAIVQWLRAMAHESGASTVRLQALCPGFVKTDMFLKAGADSERLPRWIWMSPERIVRESFAALAARRLVCIPGRRYRWMIFALKWVPASISIRVTGRMFGNFSKYRISANRLP